MHVGILDLEHLKVIWGHSCTFPKKGRNSKMAHHRAKTKQWNV